MCRLILQFQNVLYICLFLFSQSNIGGDNMPYGNNWAECPNCGKKASNSNEIEEKFGYRNMGDGRNIPQSHCRECRLKELAEKK